ncbi:lamin-A-like [Mugil cephalus]|uniref:lamin-A-like n=1 Tax=Mugil cephalus TaxID=48193 RepID=UPI001FB660FC|nr:lamin-A-like [Mugil cephalus]
METRNKEMEEIKQKLEKLTGDNNELQEEKKKLKKEMETRNKEMETRNKEMETRNKELETKNKEMEEIKDENSSSSDSQETSGDITVVVNDNYRYISLRNKSDQDKPLGGRQLKVQINNKKPITYTFDPSVKLKTGKSVTIWPSDHEYYKVPGDLVWEDLKSWWPGDRVQVSLQ